MPKTPKKLFLLDGMSLIYRAYFALSKAITTTANQINTGAILGFVNTLVEVLQKEEPTHIIVAFDAKATTFRHELFPAYKSHRQEQPEGISEAIPYIKEILDGFGIVYREYPGYEADDLLGTLAKQAAANGLSVYIMSTDKDLAQIVGDNIYLYKPASHGNKATILGEKEILAAWQINKIAQVTDILALAGDASDFIPGIPSIGKKTAQKLIQQFDSVENLLASSHQLTGKIKEVIIQYADQGMLSKKLATISTTVPITLDVDGCSYRGPDQAKLEPLFTLLEFKGLIKRLFYPQDTPKKRSALPSLFDPSPAATQENNHNNKDYTLVETLSDFQQLIQKLQSAKEWSFDVFSTDLDPHQATLLAIAIAYEKGAAYYIPLPTDATTKQPFLSCLQTLFADTQSVKVGHNLKYKLTVLQRHGVYVASPLFDLMIAHALLEPDKQPLQVAKGVDLSLQLYHKFSVALQAEGLKSLFDGVEMPLVQVLASMEIEGVAIDTFFLYTLGKSIQEDIEKIKQKIYAFAATTFNINSPKQLGEVLFKQLQLNLKPNKTAHGQYATGEEVLAKLSKTHPIIEAIMAYRILQKLLSTYVDKLPALVHPIDRRLHTDYQQTVVATGRLSSITPNLQNIPIKTAQGREIRRAFIPHHPGDWLFTADYSQIELRVMAAYAQDDAMTMAFANDLDIHQFTASRLFKVSLDEVNSDMRSKAKMANFGIIYGISAFGLAERMRNISRKEADQLILDYFERFPGIKRYMEAIVAYAQERGYVTTMLGRKRWLPNIHSRNATVRKLAERSAINTPIQGSAAEMIKLAMIEIHHWLQKEKLKSRMVMQVHDELVFNVPEEEISVVTELVIRCMVNALPLPNIPIKVNGKIGRNWLEIAPIP
ncbi:MAG: DNA polymerase I [Amoebophilaceae bacterium]|nr:DNA polymerase I [Amoebophilaceae bacterium]